ncbi:DHA2 family efflux MFS transporter permease subunit [Jiella sp. MQZ9-1]|uniref:DHA2 family efflux MFS transporter permease subunit n=1 Tax=Jiella flava TaxID=2816857 RepID=A0A939FUJ8_9HYPH|nr:DHA2 family efflux MFS transporter permease subunit [Jiella flava]MBO0662213.1 DHA2 family efflux MFS transporter permease subunit [Jiella flava]MCD2470956.1 DHA2 family efflux MFS transporter permease subunit [Jiella flava]
MSGAQTGPAVNPDTVPNKGLITVSIMLATVMQVLDTTIANVALPNMQGSLGASQDQISWVLTSYIVAAAIMTPVTGWLSDRIGLRELFIASSAGFVAASMACGLSGSLNEMIFFRLIQGLCGAALVPLSQTVLLTINRKEDHGRAMAIWGAGIMVGPIIGPTLGGWLTETFNWRYVFFVNLPIGALALAGMVFFLPKTPTRKRGFDFFGFAMLSLFIGALQLFLDRGEQLDWFASAEIWIELGLTITGLWVFTLHITGREHAFIDPKIFTDRNLVSALVMIFVVGIILLAGLALLPPMLQNILGYPVVTTGVVLAPRGVGTMIAMLVVGRLVGNVDTRVLIFVGLVLTAISLWQMSGFSVTMDETPIIVSGIIQGLGLGLVFVPLSTLAFATLEPRYRADAASLFSLLRNIGSSVGISIVTVELARNIAVSSTGLVANISPFNPNFTSLASSIPLDQQTMMAVLFQATQGQAAMIAYVDDFKLMMIITLCAIPLLALMSPPKPRQGGGDSEPTIAME